MSQNAPGAIPTFYPYFDYKDAVTALQFLAEAFGFEKSAEISGDNGTIIHAEPFLSAAYTPSKRANFTL